MRLFLDTADIEEIREINRWGVLVRRHDEPVAASPKEAEDPDVVWKEILETVHGDISLETTATEADAMYEQGRRAVAEGAERRREGSDDARAASRPASG